MQTSKVETTPAPDSPAIPGPPMALDAFIKWIKHAENSGTVSIEEAKLRWAEKREQLQRANQ